MGFDFSFDLGEVLQEAAKVGVGIAGGVAASRLGVNQSQPAPPPPVIQVAAGMPPAAPPKNDPPPQLQQPPGGTAQPPAAWYASPGVLIGFAGVLTVLGIAAAVAMKK